MNNLFSIATKELSQDALIHWILNWINFKENKEMYEISINMYQYIFNEAKKHINLEEYDIKIYSQYNFIDILVILYEKKTNKPMYAIIIEDKKLTTEHNSQMNNYKNKIIKIFENIKKENVITVYYKPYEEICEINADVILNRQNLLKKVFNKNIQNDIYMDYKTYLEEIENISNNIERIEIEKWNKHKEIFYMFAKKYKNEYKEKMKISQVRGSTYIDCHEIKKIPYKYKAFLKSIYLSININYETYEIRIRGKVNKYNTEMRKIIEKQLENIFKMEKFKIKKFIHKKGNKTINLLSLELCKETKYNELVSKIIKIEKIFDKIS